MFDFDSWDDGGDARTGAWIDSEVESSMEIGDDVQWEEDGDTFEGKVIELTQARFASGSTYDIAVVEVVTHWRVIRDDLTVLKPKQTRSL